MSIGNSTKSIGLGVWIDRVLDRQEKIEPHWSADDIHDLRVALRRSRTMAEALSEVNPAPEWRKIKKASRELFHTLGDLRDTQLARLWVRKLGVAGDPVRRHLLRLLAQREEKHRRLAAKALHDFDRKSWRKWRRKLDPKARFFPLESVVFQRIAVARLGEAFDLYQQARRRRSSIAWHRTRIAIKRFRYVVENFLPQRYQVWERDLKRAQDLLGELHDLDVLRAFIRRETRKIGPAIVAQWLSTVDRERKVRLKEFLQKSSGVNPTWSVWREGFQTVHVLNPTTFPQSRTA